MSGRTSPDDAYSSRADIALASAETGAARSEAPSNSTTQDSYWTSLAYFNGYRLVLAALFLLSAAGYGTALNFGQEQPRLFVAVAIAYAVLAVVFHVLLFVYRRHFDAHLSAQVIADVVAIGLFIYTSGGQQSGLALMLLISLAGAALVSHGRMILFYAALATIAVLGEHLVRLLTRGLDAATFLQPALVSMAFFATALIVNFLAGQVVSSERLARERGVRLANQRRVNELIMQDAQDGIVVVDAAGAIQQYNRQAEVLLGRLSEGVPLADVATPLETALQRWRAEAHCEQSPIELARSGRRAYVRFLDAGMPVGGSIIYLEDEAILEERARQHKLAALGRLTANIAHEIRNPLSAIVHAGDLLDEENRAPQRLRLTRIIRDNAARLERMVQDVLELNRRDGALREDVPLGRFVEDFLQEFGPTQEVPGGGISHRGLDDFIIRFDRVHLHQVLWNLVGNAWRHSSQQPGSVVLEGVRTADYLALHVTDDGTGVPKSLQPQLFEPFFTTYSLGTGLGLYIARELCAANGARLEYVEREQGAEFRILWQHSNQ